MTGTTIALPFLILALNAAAGGYVEPRQATTLVEIQELLFNERFGQADSVCAVLIARQPDNPAGYLFRAATLLAEMVRHEENLFPVRFHRLLDTTECLANAALDTASTRTAAWMHLFLGHTRVYRSLWEARFGAFTTSLRQGMAAREEYQKGLKYDSSLYDLYFGLGSYHYWKSAKAGILRWLGFFKNEKDKGLAELYRAADSSIISREAARNSLIWIWLDLEQFDSAVAISREMFTRYPEGTVLLWPMAQAYFENHNYRDALRTFLALRERLESQPGNYFNLIDCDYRLHRCYERLDMKDPARRVAREVAAYYSEIPSKTRQKQRTKLAYLRRAARR